MPRIHDARNDSGLAIALRGIVFVVACVVAFVMFRNAGHLVGDPTSAFARYRTPAVMPHVFVHGSVLYRTTAEVVSIAPLCRVEHERWVQCGKNRCWKVVESFNYSAARIGITDATGPLPSPMDLTPDFQFEPWTPPRNVVDTNAHAVEWRDFAKKNNLGFADNGFHGSDDRIVETCVSNSEPVFLEACVSPTRPGVLEKCPGQEHYGVIANGEPEAALDDAADNVARYVGGAALALLVAALAWGVRLRRPIMAGLEERAAPHRKSLGPIWALFGVPPALGLATVFMHGSHPPSTWSTGRGGFAFALSVLTAWLFFALQRWMHRRRTLFALAPVLATPRSPLAQASGTAELAVRAQGADLRSFIGDEPVAFSELVITETYRQGRNSTTHQVYRGRLLDRLKVVDESGEGVLDLSKSVLDVEQRTVTMTSLSPRYLERGVSVTHHPNHVTFTVKEWIIKDGEPLYVLGDVSDIALQASEGGYRAVCGSPTLGGQDAAPVLVHSGDERGLIALLSREARAANSYAVVAACMCTGIAAALVALARF